MPEKAKEKGECNHLILDQIDGVRRRKIRDNTLNAAIAHLVYKNSSHPKYQFGGRKTTYLSIEKTNQAMDKISNTAQSAKESTQEAGQQVKAKAQGAVDAVKDSTNMSQPVISLAPWKVQLNTICGGRRDLLDISPTLPVTEAAGAILAAEVRIPVKNTFVYAFAEHGNDLGSSVSVQRNPTKAYMRNGYGSSYGVGVKLGQVRAEYAIDHNSRRGMFFVHCGERF
ncbi:Omp85 domain-containing protein [Forsythia ovata]|uniref:Omp85 domain-containing protein n=1 Tax=Forsythia ovata TaxID=205694 RepID=A0ABD1WR20_9LAMI